MNNTKKISIAFIVIVAFVSGILFTTVGANLLNLGDKVGSQSKADNVAYVNGTTAIDPGRLTSAVDLEDAFTMVAETVNETVVQIRAEKVISTNYSNPFEGTPFERFFTPAPQDDRGYRSEGLGSGVIVRENGFIVTNNHVVEGADELQVMMMDGAMYDAEIVGTDPTSDLAVIRIDAKNLPFVSYGTSESIRVGQWVMAFGSPLSEELSNTVTAGIVSAVGRLTSSGESNVQNYIQTDAAINPGNSGGPLVNLSGELIAINTAIYSRTGGYQGVGFAIPVNTVKNVTDQLIDTGSVQRARLGVRYGPASETLIDALDLPRGAALIASVDPGTAAEKAGIEPGDAVVAINGQELTNYLELTEKIRGMQPGDKVNITINREGDTKNLVVTLDTDGSESSEAVAANTRSDNSSDKNMMEDLGLSLSDITPAIARNANIEGNVEGVFLTDVDPNSTAYREANLRAGQIIIEINRQPVRNMAEFQRIYDDIKSGVTFLVRLTDAQQSGTYITALTKPE